MQRDEAMYKLRQQELLNELVNVFGDDPVFLRKINRLTFGLISGTDYKELDNNKNTN